MNIFTISITDFTLQVIIGVLEHERVEKQKVIVNAKIDYDKDEHFLDYVHVVEAIKNLLEYKMYDTVENAVEGIIKSLKVDFPEIKAINLKIEKPAAVKDAIIGVEKNKKFA